MNEKQPTSNLQPGVLLAQQPILNLQEQVVAYELLFRGDFSQASGEQASATVLLNAFEQGLMQPDQNTPMFVNFTEELLFSPPPFDPDSIVIELLEDIEPSASVVSQARGLQELGYRIALDDFVYTPEMIPLLKAAQIVKIDVMDTPLQALPHLVKTLEPYNVRLLAEKVEDYETFYQCKALGFEWFQGYFFARPNLIKGRNVSPNKSAVLSMVAALQQPDLDLQALETIISSDPGLTYKVLRLSNSAAMRRDIAIETISKATSMLGLRRLQNFGTLLALGQLEEKPSELQIYTRERGLLCERLGAVSNGSCEPAAHQTVGILSCCDAYFDEPLEALLFKLPIGCAAKEALIAHRGELGVVLSGAIAIQEGRWNDLPWTELAELGLSAKEIGEVQRETASWANSNGEVELW